MDIDSKLLTANFYGDHTRWFIGHAVKRESTTGHNLTRVKIRAIGIHDNIKDEDLPWASVVLPTTEGGKGTGSAARIDVGAQVFGVFLDGKDSQVPVILGSIPFVVSSYDTLNNDATKIREAILAGIKGVIPAGTTSGASSSKPGVRYPASVAGEMTYAYFRKIGYSDVAARGIYGNLKAESAFRAEVIAGEVLGDTSGTDRGGSYERSGLVRVAGYRAGSYGVAQWYSDGRTAPNRRFKQLLDFADRNKQNWKDLETQLAFVNHELETSFKSTKLALKQCTEPGQAAVEFMRTYEIPAIQGAKNCPGTRQNSAYPSPAYKSIGKTVAKRCGEDERINNAVNATFGGAKGATT